jgi:transposase
MRPFGSPKLLARRRRRAMRYLREGLALREVARRLNASVSSVSTWRDAYQARGEAGLDPRPVSGRPTKLDSRRLPRLWAILLKGAAAYGYPNDLGTLERIAQVIRHEFGVRYHPSHVWKILRKARWSCQVPERRAIQRDEDAIAHWQRYRWPAIKKSPQTWCPPRLPG